MAIITNLKKRIPAGLEFAILSDNNNNDNDDDDDAPTYLLKKAQQQQQSKLNWIINIINFEFRLLCQRAYFAAK